MKVLLLGGSTAKELLDWLKEQGESVVYREDKITIDDIKQIKPDIVISYNYRFLISKEIIEYMNSNIVNLHISLLPWNRGSYPNVWSFLENTPKGVSIHYIDDGIDTGDVILQKEVFIDEEKEILRISYEKLHREVQELFKENWENIKTSKIKAKKQIGGGVSTTKETSSCSNPLLQRRDGILLLKNLRKILKIQDIFLKNFVNLTNEEKEMVLKWRNSEAVKRWCFTEYIISNKEHMKFIEGLKNDDKDFYWLVQHKKDDKYLGIVSLNRLNFSHKNAYLGIYANPELLGVGGLLMDCLKKLVFDVLGLHTLKLEVIETNRQAISFYKKLGFKQEGRLKEFVYKDSGWLDVIVMGMVNK